jgi:hypothetical protein
MRTDAVSFVVWLMPLPCGREHPAIIGIILYALHQPAQAACATLSSPLRPFNQDHLLLDAKNLAVMTTTFYHHK